MALTIDIINNVRKLFEYKQWNLNNEEGKLFNNLKSASNLNGNLNCSKELEHYAS